MLLRDTFDSVFLHYISLAAIAIFPRAAYLLKSIKSRSGLFIGLQGYDVAIIPAKSSSRPKSVLAARLAGWV